MKNGKNRFVRRKRSGASTSAFATWWENLSREWRKDRDYPYGTIRRGRKHLESVPRAEKKKLLDGLIGIICGRQKGDRRMALALIEGYARNSDLAIINRIARSKLNYRDKQSEGDLVEFLRVLAKGETRFHGPLTRYLKQDPLPEYYFYWPFWPQYPALFVWACSRYLSKTPLQRWARTAVVQAFLHRLDALAVLRDSCRALVERIRAKSDRSSRAELLQA